MSAHCMQQVRVLLMLVRKDMFLLTAKLGPLFLDGLFPLLCQVVTYGYLFPFMGLSTAMIIPVYLGSMLGLILHLGFAFLMRVAADLNTNRIINYHSTLPISKTGLCISYILSNVIETLIVTVPLIAAGLWVLRAHFSTHAVSIPLLIMVMLVNQFFFTIFFLTCAVYYDFYWIMDNMWPRRIVPLICASSMLVPWYKVYAWWPELSYVMLFSPLTYVSEGMRSALLGSAQFIDPMICVSALLLWIGICVVFLRRGMYKRLDPV